MEILINNKQDSIEVDLLSLKKLAEFILVFEKISSLTELSVAFLDEEEMERLNSQYRKMDVSTDVLSFPLFDKLPHNETEHPLVLGDVIICPVVARRNAQKVGHSIERELELLLIHGVLHLLGYDHVDSGSETLMKARQRKILNKFARSEFGA